jgi:hypothetical protein
VFLCDAERFESSARPTTDPSHDLVHLILAANGGLPWLPSGERDLVCLAEYNAVLLENLYDKSYNSARFGVPAPEQTLAEAVKHLRWFVEEHYKPFPCSPEEAYRRFCRRVDPETVTRLFPYYFDLKKRERDDPWTVRDLTFHFDFTSEDDPIGSEACRAAQRIVRSQVKAVAG